MLIFIILLTFFMNTSFICVKKRFGSWKLFQKYIIWPALGIWVVHPCSIVWKLSLKKGDGQNQFMGLKNTEENFDFASNLRFRGRMGEFNLKVLTSFFSSLFVSLIIKIASWCNILTNFHQISKKNLTNFFFNLDAARSEFVCKLLSNFKLLSHEIQSHPTSRRLCTINSTLKMSISLPISQYASV